MTEDIKQKNTILYGNELRSLLNSDHVTYGEIQNTLKAKGIFTGDTSKHNLVPLLSTTLLKPTEFVDLLEATTIREMRPKCKISSIELTQSTESTINWVPSIKDTDFNYIIQKHENDGVTKFSRFPNVIVVSPSKVRIPYSITRNDYSADWIQREITYDAEISIEQKENTLILDISTTHSSKETERVNRSIRNELIKQLNNNSLTSNDSAIEIKFDSFNNKQRVKFFKNLTAGATPAISTGDVDNIEIMVDETTLSAIPDDPEVKWLKTAVKKVRIDGSKMNNIFLIANESYYDFYQMHKMDIAYDFSTDSHDGKCKVCFSFSDPNSRTVSKNSDLTYSITSLSATSTMNSKEKKATTDSISKNLGHLIEHCFKSSTS